MNNTTIAHEWAHQTRESRRGSNFFFEGRSIYSYGYHFEVGRVLEKKGRKVYLLNDSRYSVSTSRHQQLARMAIPKGENVSVFYMPDIWEGLDIYIVHMLETMYSEAEKLLRAKTFGLYDFGSQSNRLFEYMYLYDMGDLSSFDGKRLTTAVKEYRLRHDGIRLDDKKALERADLIQKIRDLVARLRGSLDTEEGRATFVDGLFGEGTYAKFIERRDRHKEKYEEKRRIQRALLRMSLKDKVKRWKKGEIDHIYLYGDLDDGSNVALRFRNGFLETSKGIKLSLDEAKRLWVIVKAFHGGRIFQHELALDVNGHKWSVNSYENDILTAGCHKISYVEMERMAIELGFEKAKKEIA